MRNCFILMGLIALLGGISGCSASADTIVEDEIRAMNNLADGVEQKAPAAEISERETKLKEIDQRLEAKKVESFDGSHQLFKRHEEGLTKAARRLKNAGISNSEWKGLLKHFGLDLYPSGPEKVGGPGGS